MHVTIFILTIRPRGYKTFFMLNSAEIYFAYKSSNTDIFFKLLSCSTQLSMLSWVEHEKSFVFFLLFLWPHEISCWVVEHEKKFITSGPGQHISLSYLSSNLNQSILLPTHMCKNCLIGGKHYRPWSDATLCSIWSWSTLFAQACLSQYLR